MTALASVSDEDRTNPANARCWNVSAGGAWTVVVATCAEEARLLGLLWISAHHGKTRVDLNTTARVRPADSDDVARWHETRRQQAGAAALIAAVKASRLNPSEENS
jgi:hypothetical protein